MHADEAQLFPELQRYAEQTDLLANAKGSLKARLPRILGQGKTRADGLDLPPADIERRQELSGLKLPEDAVIDPGVRAEIDAAAQAVKAHVERMRHPENQRRFAFEALDQLKPVITGRKDNHFFAGRLVLLPEEGGLSWSWSMTPHCPLVSKIPADMQYVVRAYSEAERVATEWTVPIEQFVDQLSLAWSIARQIKKQEKNILIADVANICKVAMQEDRFWKSPARRNFTDIPDGVFMVNLINWRQQRENLPGPRFELVPATLNQAHGPKSRAFFVPVNQEGTSVRPMIYINRIEK